MEEAEDRFGGSSLPDDLGYGDEVAAVSGVNDRGNIEEMSENKPRILLMGLRRSGKSSIVRVVFHKMSPHETLFLESTSRIVRSDIANSSFLQFQVWDFPGQIDFFDAAFDSQSIFASCSALVFVIDAQDDYTEALARLVTTVQKAHEVNGNIIYEVFIHKVDGLSEDHKLDTQRGIQQSVSDDLSDLHMNVDVSYSLTSIYDHSVFEAFSNVIQKLVRQRPTLEKLLDILVANSRVDKAFLFDVVSKTFLATDSSPVDTATFELCSDMIDVVVDVSSIYGSRTLSRESLRVSGDRRLGDSSRNELTEMVTLEGIAYDPESSSAIKLSNKTVLTLRYVNRHLALVCLIREENYDKIGLIDYNFECFRESIRDVFEAKKVLRGVQHTDTASKSFA